MYIIGNLLWIKFITNVSKKRSVLVMVDVKTTIDIMAKKDKSLYLISKYIKCKRLLKSSKRFHINFFLTRSNV